MTVQKQGLGGEDCYLEVGGIRTRLRVAGAGEPVLLLHGIGRSLEDWSAAVAPLAQHLKVYAFDMVGFGRSDKPEASYTPDYLRDFTLRLMDALRVEKAVLVGNSMGGAVAARMALARPERVRALVLADPGGFGQKVSPLLSLCTLPLLGEWLTANAKDAGGARRVLQACFHDQSFVTDALAAHSHELSLLPGRQQAFLKTLRAACDWRGLRPEFLSGILGRLGELRVPTLVVWGKQDQILPAEYAQNARFIPDVETKILDPCGHFPQLERPQEFTALVLDFLRRKGL